MSDNPPIEFAFPELRRWEKGAAPYIHVLDSGKPGPAVMVAALTHGNEVSGAVVVDALLAAGLKPRQGTLIFSFNNIEAYHSFDAKTPFKSRLVDEDFNRTWGRLDQPANTVETRRAQVVRPFIERADFLLDLHSMHDDGVPLMLAGPLDKGVALAKKIGTPVDSLLLYCYHYDPMTGRYGLAIMRAIRIAGAATVLAIGAFIIVMLRRERRTLERRTLEPRTLEP